MIGRIRRMGLVGLALLASLPLATGCRTGMQVTVRDCRNTTVAVDASGQSVNLEKTVTPTTDVKASGVPGL